MRNFFIVACLLVLAGCNSCGHRQAAIHIKKLKPDCFDKTCKQGYVYHNEASNDWLIWYVVFYSDSGVSRVSVPSLSSGQWTSLSKAPEPTEIEADNLAVTPEGDVVDAAGLDESSFDSTDVDTDGESSADFDSGSSDSGSSDGGSSGDSGGGDSGGGGE